MAELFKFWSHGVALVPQFSKPFTNTDNGLHMERADWGTKVSQDTNTSNWFHFPLTSGSTLDGDGAFINRAFFLAAINRDAAIRRIHVTMIDQSPLTQSPILLVNDNVNFTNVDDRFNFSFRDTLLAGALVLSVYAEFARETGEIIFKSAGADTFES